MLKCAFYEKEITPPLGSEIPGYYSRRISSDVLDKLYAKAVAFDDGKTQTALVVLDSVSVPEKYCKLIRERVYNLCGLAHDKIAVCATHTHLGLPVGEDIDSGSREDKAVMNYICVLAADCVVLALKRLQNCSASFGTGCVDNISFNRDYVMSDGSIRTNPKSNGDVKIISHHSENDPELSVMCLRDQAGTPIGAIISYPCHQDCVGGTSFSGDYSSELSRQLKARYGENFVSIYVSGASGDINHINALEHRRSNYIEMGRLLANEAVRVIETLAERVTGEDVNIKLAFVPCTRRRATAAQIEYAQKVLSGEINCTAMLGNRMSELLLRYEAEADGNENVLLPVQVMVVGDLPIFILPGEIYHKFGFKIKDSCPGRRCIIATLSNVEDGYIVTPDLVKSDIYPAQLCKWNSLTPDTGDKLVSCAISAAAMLIGWDK